MMRFAIVGTPGPTLLRAAVRLHIDALSGRSFLTAFGARFLIRLYAGLVARQIGFLVTAHDGDHLAGFILACTDSRRLGSIVTGSPLTFAALMAPTLARHPRLLPKLVETAVHGLRERSSIAAELLVIAVDRDHRSAGIGRQLLAELRTELRDRGIAGFKVTVHHEMTAANRFYAANGLRLANTFGLYGVRWNLYVDELP